VLAVPVAKPNLPRLDLLHHHPRGAESCVGWKLRGKLISRRVGNWFPLLRLSTLLVGPRDPIAQPQRRVTTCFHFRILPKSHSYFHFPLALLRALLGHYRSFWPCRRPCQRQSIAERTPPAAAQRHCLAGPWTEARPSHRSSAASRLPRRRPLSSTKTSLAITPAQLRATSSLFRLCDKQRAPERAPGTRTRDHGGVLAEVAATGRYDQTLCQIPSHGRVAAADGPVRREPIHRYARRSDVFKAVSVLIDPA
jgi:hypothetical protein